MEAAEIVGFDLGDGESCLAAACPGTAQPKMLDVQGDKRILSAVARHPALGTVFGRAAAASSEARDLRVRFKARGLSDPGAAQALRDFAQAVRAAAIAEGRLGAEGAERWYVGCPSGWGPEPRERYRRLLRDAGLPRAEVLPESRAAFLYARESDLRVSDERLRRGVIVIDVGSSTTDATIVRGLAAAPVDAGAALGAGLLEEAILERAVARSPDAVRVREAFARAPWARARAELDCRRFKETYFSMEDRWRTEAYADAIRIPASPPIHLEVVLDRDAMAETLAAPLSALGGLSWPEALRALLSRAREAMGGEAAGLVLLTGGGSRMRFVAEACREAFPEARVETDREPEFAVARGLAYAGRIAEKVGPFRGEVAALAASGAIAARIREGLDGLRTLLADRIAGELLAAALLRAVREWRDGALPRLRDVQGRAEALGEAWLRSPEAAEATRESLAAWSRAVVPEIEALTRPICDRYDLPRSALGVFGAFDVSGLAGVAARPFGAFEVFGAQRLAVLASAAAGLVLANLLGGAGIALLLHGPVGWAVGLVLGAAGMWLGAARADSLLKNADLPAAARRLAPLGALERRIGEKRAELARGVREVLAGDAEFEPLVAQIAEGVRTALLLKADEAELQLR